MGNPLNMKYLCIIIIMILFKSDNPYSRTIDSSYIFSDVLYINLFSNAIEPKENFYESVLQAHDINKTKQYDSLTLVYATEYINNEVCKLLHQIYFNVNDSYVTDLKIDQFAFTRFNLDWQYKPIISSDRFGFIPKTQYSNNIKMPSFSSMDFNCQDPNDSVFYFSLLKRYVNYSYTEDKNQYVASISKKQLKTLYEENMRDINKIHEPILKLLCLFQLELFMFQNNGIWSSYYFFNFRMKEIEKKIYHLSAEQQSFVYYSIGKILTNSREYGNYRYKYFYKSYYLSTKYNLKNNEFGIRSLTYLNFILGINAQNPFYRKKSLELLIDAEKFSIKNRTDSINIQLLKYTNIIQSVLRKYGNNSDTGMNIYELAHYDLMYLLRYAQNNNIKLNEWIASKSYNLIGTDLILWCSRYNHGLSITYNALSVKSIFESPDLPQLFIKPMDDEANMLIFKKDYKRAREVINKMLYYSDFIEAPNFTGNALVRLLYYYNDLGMQDSLTYTKTILDSMLSIGQIDPYVSYLYAQSLKDVGLSNNLPKMIQQANQLFNNRQNDFTIEYSSIVKVEQEAKDEILEAENARLIVNDKNKELEIYSLIGGILITIIAIISYYYINKNKKELNLHKNNLFKEIIYFHSTKFGLESIVADAGKLYNNATLWKKDLDFIIDGLYSVTDSLSEYYKYVKTLLENSKKDNITLQNELSNCDLLIRFICAKDKIDVTLDYQSLPNLDTIKILPNVMIPIIENCYSYGFHKLNKGCIKITKKGKNINITHNGNPLKKSSGTGMSLDTLSKYLNSYNKVNNTHFYFDQDDPECKFEVYNNGKFQGVCYSLKNFIK